MLFQRRLLTYFLIILLNLAYVPLAYCLEWSQEKSSHFKIQFDRDQGKSSSIQGILNKAEEYYVKVAKQIGYPRYAKFWTWDDRVRIIIYPDQEKFVKATGQPIWAIGGVKREDDLHSTHSIVSFQLEKGFLENVLPHEITHLVLHDYVGSRNNIPIWFDEGLAQVFEKDKVEKANETLKSFVRNNRPISIKELHSYDPRREINPMKVSMFYIQSASIIDFMIKKYGSYNFQQLCSYLKEGHTFTQALHKTYLGTIDSLANLEKKWLRSMEY